jgi:hypothetical protein
MISVGFGGVDALLRVNKDDLLSLSPNPLASLDAFDAFVDANVIKVDGTSAELTSEVLLKSWSRIRGWLEADRTGLYIRQSLTEAATRWRREGRPISALYPEDSLAVAEIWAQDAANYRDLGQLERDFLSASQAARGQVKTPASRALWPRRLSVMIAILISLALVIVIYFIVPVIRTSPGATPSPPNPPVGGASTVLAGYTSVVTDAQYGPDGRILASSSEDGKIWLWNVVDPSRPTPFGQPQQVSPDGVTSVAFGPDGRILAGGSTDGTVLLWDVSDPARLRRLGDPLSGHTASVTSVAFSPDGRILASGSTDRTVRLWVTATGQPHGQPLTGPTAAVTSVSIKPDGGFIAGGSADQTVVQWRLN